MTSTVVSPTPPRRRWRFTIRQMLLAFFLVGAALALYREIPDMVRKVVYNDPIPLKITDRSKIQVRQIPYLPGHSFLYRVALPRGKQFDLCAGIATAEDSIPTPQQVVQLRNPSGPSEEVAEWRIHGFQTRLTKDDMESKFNVEIQRVFTMISDNEAPLTLQFTPTTLRTWVRFPGLKATDTYDDDAEIVLYREYWRDQSDETGFIENEYKPGAGLVVWIRPRPAEKK
jgi:hypothetical protein